MRISAYTLRHPPVSCFVNGILQKGVVEADTVEGWCRKLKRDISGNWRVNASREELEEETIHGNVSIRWDRIAPNWRPE